MVFSRDTLSSGAAGMILSYSLLVCDAASCMIRVAIEVEKCVVSAERIEEYTRVESEAPWTVDDGPAVGEKWPDRGNVELVNYFNKYRSSMGTRKSKLNCKSTVHYSVKTENDFHCRPDGDYVMKNINLKISSGEKVGVVGRSGAGKSTLVLGLFRLLEPAGGKIIIDGIDTSKYALFLPRFLYIHPRDGKEESVRTFRRLGLHCLRGRLTMIPQEPTLFKGTIRSNLDPCGNHSDEEVWSALERAHLKSNMLQLTYEVSDGKSPIHCTSTWVAGY